MKKQYISPMTETHLIGVSQPLLVNSIMVTDTTVNDFDKLLAPGLMDDGVMDMVIGPELFR